MTKLYSGARINALRKAHGLTQAMLAEKLELSTSYLNQLENDKRPLTATVLLHLTKAFAVEAGYFSPDNDASTVAELSEALSLSGGPVLSSTELSDLAARFPTIARHIIHPASPETDHRTPYDYVRDYFAAHRNHIDPLDRLGEQLAETLGTPGMRVMRLTQLLDQEFNFTVRFRAPGLSERRHVDHSYRQIFLREDLTESQQCFQLAQEIAGLQHVQLLEALTDDHPDLPTPEAVELAKVGLAQYFAGAVVMPYGSFLDFARSTRFDIDLISARFGVSFESTCHRLSTLQRQGNEGVPFFFVRSDRAGNISKRQSAATFHFSRTNGTCPLWTLHQAFESQGTITRQVARMPDGRTYLWMAKSVRGRSSGFGNPVAEFAIGLGCDISEAPHLVYSQGLNLDPSSAAEIGPGCRVCPREDCVQRAFPATGQDLLRRR
ncbi:short-chain fatty acyl-CoA regulator family protein [uncultured Corynebacterium sp.]|uniref:short-chain fatty acyl-CoA regulator family protein n=1 Tax=uncultured Corynebacterium sp. TaxID=159447 RepID=UPI0025E4FA61|nr:short-chain fatty acyl-CoA regulator family protein [uncultured Corynebacterium sp.]